MRWNIDLYKTVRHAVPHFLQKMGDSLVWVTQSGLIWVTSGGLSWGTGTPSRHMDWIKSLLAPIQSLNATFTSWAANIVYLMNLTGQVIYLEHYLNDLFDDSQRRIFISDGSLTQPDYLYNNADNSPTWHLYNTGDNQSPYYLYTRQDYFGQSEFIVNLPTDIPITSDLEFNIRAAVNRYKQAGVRYTIQNV